MRGVAAGVDGPQACEGGGARLERFPFSHVLLAFVFPVAAEAAPTEKNDRGGEGAQGLSLSSGCRNL